MGNEACYVFLPVAKRLNSAPPRVWGFAGLLLAALSFVSSWASAAPEPALAALEQRVHVAVKQWELARQRRARTQTEVETLEHRIAALKRLRADGTERGEAELTALLRRSIDAERALEHEVTQVERAAIVVQKSAYDAIIAIDARINTLKPRLQQGELEQKKAAARAINALRSSRQQLRDVVARVRQPAAVPQEWARYEVRIEPLDGPRELRDKADFVEDTRERFHRKLLELRRVIRDARDEREISRAASDFQTDTRLFDEEARRDRVQRGQGTAVALSAPRDQAANAPQSGSAGPEAASPTADVAAPAADVGFDATPPLGNPPSVDDGSGGPGGSPARGNSGATTMPELQRIEPPELSKLDPNVLLNLRIETLEGGRADLATLERYARELEKLERFLSDRADTIRVRAKQLEADETRALGR
jgi:hypothetical protein